MNRIQFFGLLLLTLFFACRSSQQENDTMQVEQDFERTNRPFNTPGWAETANIYELNVRQYTPEGTFAAMRQHLPRLKEMGVDVIWFMPIYPISEEKRKGSMGSYYASANFTAVNPEFGTMQEFKEVVAQIHDLGMHVILDWTANHTGWDHPWIKEHPEYYIKREGTDTIRHAFNPNDGGETDWYDIAQLDYSNPDLTPAMIQQMKFWLEEADVDGFRCDVAGFVPIDFWFAARPELEKVKPIFMLAEWGDEPRHFQAAFDINYGWDFHKLLNRIAEGEANVEDIWEHQRRDTASYADYAYHLNFTSNHDENSWNGTEYERMGDLADALWIVCATFEGAPLIYSGQEEPLKRRLAFFEKDDIGFRAYAKADFFKPMLSLKQQNAALGNGLAGGIATRIQLKDSLKNILAFRRDKGKDSVLVFVNFEKSAVEVKVDSLTGTWKNVYTGEQVTFSASENTLQLEPNGYLVFSNK